MVGPYGQYQQLRPAKWQYSDRSVLSSLLPTQYWYQLLMCYTAFFLITMRMTHWYYCYYGSCLNMITQKHFVTSQIKNSKLYKNLRIFIRKLNTYSLWYYIQEGKKTNYIAIKMIDHNSSLIFNVKAISNCGCILKLFVLENTHSVFCSNAQFQKQSGI